MHYTATTADAFASIEHIMRDVNYGWLVRYVHANGASLFFAIVYLHIARGLYFRSYAFRHLSFVWVSGILIFLLLMATAFLGYILPWGQMSFWGATVITNLFSAIPVIGKTIVAWLWGGFSVGNATLARFYSLHYLLPFVIIALVIVHLACLHWAGSSAPDRNPSVDYCTFLPYFYIKDLFALCVFLIIWSYFVFFAPESLGHPDNYIPANPMATPAHIVPEWYFLPFYAILRSVPSKLGGVLLMFGAIASLAMLPVYSKYHSKLKTKLNVVHGLPYCVPASLPIHPFAFSCFIFVFIVLGWLGAQPASEPYITISLWLTFLYFFYLTVWQYVWLHVELLPHRPFARDAAHLRRLKLGLLSHSLKYEAYLVRESTPGTRKARSSIEIMRSLRVAHPQIFSSRDVHNYITKGGFDWFITPRAAITPLNATTNFEVSSGLRRMRHPKSFIRRGEFHKRGKLDRGELPRYDRRSLGDIVLPKTR
jgi:quinol-cytochrome oxidoreductase complex cytochrome b subunit